MLFDKKSTTKIEALIGMETEIEGSIRSTESIRIDGKIKGGVNADAIIIGEHGHILGDISANKVTVGGKVKGNISASQLLEIMPKGVVIGDIRTSKLIISDGANFEGNCQMLKADGQIIEMTPVSNNEADDSHQKHLKVVSNGKR